MVNKEVLRSFIFFIDYFKDKIDIISISIFLSMKRSPDIDSNKAPVLRELPDRILSEDSQLLDTIDLNYFCSDPDSDVLSYSIIRNTEPDCGVMKLKKYLIFFLTKEKFLV